MDNLSRIFLERSKQNQEEQINYSDEELLALPKLGGLQNSVQDGKSRGLYLDFPGIRPIYVGGFLSDAKTQGFNLGFGASK